MEYAINITQITKSYPGLYYYGTEKRKSIPFDNNLMCISDIVPALLLFFNVTINYHNNTISLHVYSFVGLKKMVCVLRYTVNQLLSNLTFSSSYLS